MFRDPRLVTRPQFAHPLRKTSGCFPIIYTETEYLEFGLVSQTSRYFKAKALYLMTILLQLLL